MNNETKPKTAEEILANNIDGLKEFIQDEEIFSFYREVILECMKETGRTVAQQVRQECADKAMTRTNDQRTSIIVDKDSILSIDIEQFIK